MMNRLVCAAAAALIAGAQPAAAQNYLGAELAYANDLDLGVGLRVDLPLEAVHERFRVTGSFIYFFPGESSDEIPGVDADLEYWEINANGRFRIANDDVSLTPYVGAGINIGRLTGSVDISGVGGASESSTELGLNVLGGLEFGRGPSRPFVEVRYEVGGGEQLVVSGGINIPIGS
ncbi:MAG: outer membrane beta-barrel protein [Gemmatimonadetes bacterium]|nr:outer membrane beta-barrel protein [Gemmatimonadota bacterium]